MVLERDRSKSSVKMVHSILSMLRIRVKSPVTLLLSTMAVMPVFRMSADQLHSTVYQTEIKNTILPGPTI